MIIAVLAVLVFASVSQAEDLPHVQWLTCSDGDTCGFNIFAAVPLPSVFGENIGVRLSGIDTPEKAGKCAKEKRLAVEARDFLRQQLTGATVVLANVFRDKYFRLEATVLANGINLNQLLVQNGYAVPYAGTGPRHNWCA